ncbi:MAG: hypothetical protein IPL71_20965 [Anaerolineales bacterium]|uniref:hypothetical protein n=1 Tax=Candidatus Villigracilis proximus TaxID=3140683 RepID=UPI0031346EAB|nr:hypothetical protein [Anaerolineales bacterium]
MINAAGPRPKRIMPAEITFTFDKLITSAMNTPNNVIGSSKLKSTPRRRLVNAKGRQASTARKGKVRSADP